MPNMSSLPQVLVLWNMARVWTASGPELNSTNGSSTARDEVAVLVVDNIISYIGPVELACVELVSTIAARCHAALDIKELRDAIAGSTPLAESSWPIRCAPPTSEIPSSRTMDDSASLNVRIVNGGGTQMLCPGFTDAHVHLLDGGKRLFSVSLRDCTCREDFVATIKAFIVRESVPPGEWITGGDWSNVLMGAFPDKSWVDEATADHLVLLARLDSHCAVVNSRVIASIEEFSNPSFTMPGGTIERDEQGVPTGVIKERAIGFVKRTLWPTNDTTARMEKALTCSGQYLQSHGITSVHVMSSLDFSNIGEIEFLLHKAKTMGRLPVRVRAAVRIHEMESLHAIMLRQGGSEDIADPFLSVGMVKFFSDGSLGSRTAAMKKPYQGTCQCGFLLQPLEELRAGILDAVTRGLQCCVHAIGDAAVAHAVDAIIDAVVAVETAAASNGLALPLRRRHRIEHCQHVDDIPTLFPRMAEYGIVASCQPSHLLVDGPYAERELGAERMRGAYCFRSMVRHKVPLAFGSDWMVAPACVMTSIDAAVSRQYEDTSKGSNRSINVWNTDEAVTVAEALEAYTLGAAAAGHQEHRVGLLRHGYLADFAVLSHDILEHGGVKDARVVHTILNGEVVFSI